MVNIILIAIALALDAFGVALGLGCGNRLEVKEKSAIVFSFGFFQFLFTLLGAFLGNYINNNLFNITNYLSGAVILMLGILLLKEGHENEEDCVYQKLGLWTYIILGISVSIDALGVGFSVLYKLESILIISNSIIIGVIASFLTLTSLLIVKYIKNFSLVEKYADYLGGFILVLFGLKMLV